MNALRWHGRRDVRYQVVENAPAPGPDEARIRVAYAGICGTDREEYREGPILIPVAEPHPLTHKTAPLILGHEFSGIVESVGRDSPKPRPDRLPAPRPTDDVPTATPPP